MNTVNTNVISKPAMSGLRGLCLLAAVFMVSGCVSKTVKRVNTTQAVQAQQDIPESQLINVNIAVFDPGYTLPVKEESGIFPEVRQAESRFVPYQLRQTLQNTGQWGAVRVVPEPIPSSELLVTGKILESDGEVLALNIRAVDASGREWLNRDYEELAAEISYSDPAAKNSEAFQDIYNRIANDLLALRQSLSAAELQNLRRLSELRFAADLGPDAFGTYLKQDDGRYSVVGYPAENDPNLARIRKIRERDYGVIDALDQHYGHFESQITPSYDEWRAASYREKANLGKLKRDAITRGIAGAVAIAAGIYGLTKSDNAVEGTASQAAIIGGAILVKSGFDKNKESKIHAEALKELGESLEGEVKPRVIELENQTVTLSGSAEAQYEEWRSMLREIYANETGFIPASSQPRERNDL